MANPGFGEDSALRIRAARGAALLIPALLLAACGTTKIEVAAVPVDSGKFGALLVSSEGEQLLPVVTRDASGQATAVTGALWMDGNGNSAYVDLDPLTGLPTRTVFGDFVLLFSNWSADHTTADVARIYGPTGYVEVMRGVRVGDGVAATAGKLTAAATCLPNCPSTRQTVAELLKVAGLGLSIGTCGVASAVSWGAMLLPCSGVVVSAAKMVSGEESWLNAPLSRAAGFLKAVDILQCVSGDASGCLSLELDTAAGQLEKEAATVDKYPELVQAAEDRMMNGALPGGVLSGSPPACIQSYECTPGAYLPCLAGGTRQCGQDCTWPECPSATSGGTCSVNAGDGDSVCQALVENVQSQCAAKGGKILSWSPDKATCVKGYKCWATSCPCLMSCSTTCGNDLTCVQACMTKAGKDTQAEATKCAACTMPQVQAQCQTGG